jgi:cytochrome c2
VGLKGVDFVWDDARLDEYLTDPKKFIKKIGGKKSKMVLKTKKASQRADVIAYLKTLK